MMKTLHRFATMALLAVAMTAASGMGHEARAGLVYFSTSDGYGHPLAFESMDTSNGAINVISTSSTPFMIGLQFVNGQLYGEGYNSPSLYQINSATGATSVVGTISPASGSGGDYYSAGANGLTYYYDNLTNAVYTLTPPSTTATLTNLNPIIGNDRLFAVGPDGQIYAVVDGSGGQTLDVLNPSTNVLTTGPTLSQQVGNRPSLFFDGSNLDFLNQSGLYTINTTTGVVTQDFAVSLGQVWSATEQFAPASVPEPSSLALCGIAGATLALASRRKWLRVSRRPGTR